MNTTDVMQLIKNGELTQGAFTVETKQGTYSDILGNEILVYTHGKPDSNILAFSVKEFLLIVESTRVLSIESFKSLIKAKRMFGGTILKEGTNA